MCYVQEAHYGFEGIIQGGLRSIWIYITIKLLLIIFKLTDLLYAS